MAIATMNRILFAAFILFISYMCFGMCRVIAYKHAISFKTKILNMASLPISVIIENTDIIWISP
jgi:type IV secretory pathway ATPase VirB11/archaellum biosynthesis ATPase